jgi:hypothetical protein
VCERGLVLVAFDPVVYLADKCPVVGDGGLDEPEREVEVIAGFGDVAIVCP